MAKKNFKSGLDDLFKENIEEINNVTETEKKVVEVPETVNVEDISDEKVKWMYIKLQRYEKELHLWRTGELTLEKFEETLEEQGLTYDPEFKEFTEVED
jgi:hypothetical protein